MTITLEEKRRESPSDFCIKDYSLKIEFADTFFIVPMCCEACALKAKFKFEEDLLKTQED